MVTTKSDEAESDSETEATADSEAGEINLEVVNKARILSNLRALKIPTSKIATVKGLAGLLAKHYDEQHRAGVTMALCDRCDAKGPESLEACPFCGEPNGDAAASSLIGGGDSEVADSIGAIERAETALAPVVGKSVNLVPIADINARRPKAPLATEDQLEVAVGLIQGYKRTFNENSWDIGHQLLLIAEETKDRPAMWRTRKLPDGSQAYDTFKAFLRAECGVNSRMAAVAMHIAKTYKRDQVALTGTTKIEIVLSAPENKRTALLASAGNTPVRKLRDKVRQLNIAEGKHSKKREVRQERAVKERAKRDVKTDEASGLVTVVLEKPKGKLWLYRQNKDAKGKLIPATQVSDNWGWLEAKNGVRLVFTVKKTASGQLQISYETKRETEADG